MSQSFFFYDLETTGINPRTARIMQFAGQRTNMDLEPIGDPVNVLIRLSPDVVPDPDAIMITGITPQQTIQDGITEAAFAKQFIHEIAMPGTIFTGFNSVRFDDEFMRFFLYRNFYDSYEWQWKENRSRWDVLDLVRMTRALRPEGITWPFDDSGKPANRLEMLTAANNIEHAHAHDALSDVSATIAIAKLIRDTQPKLFQYILDIRNKRKVAELVDASEPFVYTSGQYPVEYEKTATVLSLGNHPKRQAALVYDLRHDPTPYLTQTPQELAELWRYKKDATEARLPIKTLKYNCCPAVAPLAVLDANSQKRLQIDVDQMQKHAVILKQAKNFRAKILQALKLTENYDQTTTAPDQFTVDGLLYDGFVGDEDSTVRRAIIAADAQDITTIAADFKDERLQLLTPLYKARNFEQELGDEERIAWEKYRTELLLGGGDSSRLAMFFARLGQLAQDESLTTEKQFLLEELQLYGQGIMPVYDEFDEQQ